MPVWRCAHRLFARTQAVLRARAAAQTPAALQARSDELARLAVDLQKMFSQFERRRSGALGARPERTPTFATKMNSVYR